VWEGEGEKRRLVADPRFKTVIEQILDFGVCDGDHIVDAVTYLLGYVTPDMMLGRGIVTDRAVAFEKLTGDPRVRAMLKRIMSGGDEKSAEQEDDEWLARNWS
jgi:hypothetical protein